MIYKFYICLGTGLIGVGILSSTISATAEATPFLKTSHQCQPQVGFVPSNVAVILKTASTNTDCERVLVNPSGHVSFVVGKKTGQGTLEPSLIRKFFRDIKIAESLSKLPVKYCLNSTSFGASTFVSLGSEKSPDLNCTGDTKAKQLFADVNAILEALNR